MASEIPAKSEQSVSSREYAEQKQVELNTTLENLLPEIDLWNQMLAEAAESTYGPEAEAALADICLEARNSLNDKWGNLMDHYMHVSGTWRTTTITASRGGTLEVHMDENEAFNVALSKGFHVLTNTLGHPRVGLSFALASGSVDNPAITADFITRGFAEPDQVSLMYVSPANKKIDMTTSGNFVSQLILLDRLLTLHYADDHSEIFRQTMNKQQRFFSSVTESLNGVLSSPVSGERAYCSDVQVPYIWQRVQEDGRIFWQKLKSEDEDPIMLTGVIESVEVLEAIDQKEPLKHTGQLIDPDAGPCLVVKVIESNTGEALQDKEVFVPCRQAENIAISVY